MTFSERFKEIQPRMEAVVAKAEQYDETVPEVFSIAVQIADGNPAKIAMLVTAANEFVNLMEIRPWVVGMTTRPGDFVLDNPGKYIYMFAGPETMTHANASRGPGNADYWVRVREAA
jgi:hypothetical protein